MKPNPLDSLVLVMIVASAIVAPLFVVDASGQSTEPHQATAGDIPDSRGWYVTLSPTITANLNK